MTLTADELYAGRVQLLEDLNALLGWWHQLDGQAAIPLFDDGLGAGLAIHNIVEHVTNLSEAICVLVAQDVSLPIVPLIRLSMECTVTAAWWAADPVSRVGSSVAEEARQKKLLAEDIVKTASTADNYTDLRNTLKARALELGTPSDEAKVFKDRCDATPGFSWAYGMYRMLSAGSHAGTALVAEYLDVDAGNALNPAGVALRQRPTWSAQPVGAELQPVLLTIALAVYDTLLPYAPLRQHLITFAQQRGFQDLVEAVIAGVKR